MEALKTFESLSDAEKIKFFQALAQPISESATDPEASTSSSSPVADFATIFQRLSKNVVSDPKSPEKTASPESNAKQKTLDGWLVKKSSPKTKLRGTEKSIETEPCSGSTGKNAVELASENVNATPKTAKATLRSMNSRKGKDNSMLNPKESSQGSSDFKETLIEDQLVSDASDEASSNTKKQKKRKEVTWSCQLVTNHPNTCTISKTPKKPKSSDVHNQPEPLPDVDSSSETDNATAGQNSSSISDPTVKKDSTPKKAKHFDKSKKSLDEICPSQDLLNETVVESTCSLGEKANVNNHSKKTCSAQTIENQNYSKPTKTDKKDGKLKNNRKASPEPILDNETSSSTSLISNDNIVSKQDCTSSSDFSDYKECQTVKKVSNSNQIINSSNKTVSVGQNVSSQKNKTKAVSCKAKLTEKSKKMSDVSSDSNVSVLNSKSPIQHSIDCVTPDGHCLNETASRQNMKSTPKKISKGKQLKLVYENLSSLSNEDKACDEVSNLHITENHKKKSVTSTKTKLCEKPKKDAVASSILPDEPLLSSERSLKTAQKSNNINSSNPEPEKKVIVILNETCSNAKKINLHNKSESPVENNSSSHGSNMSLSNVSYSFQDSIDKVLSVQKANSSDAKKVNLHRSKSPVEKCSSSRILPKSLPANSSEKLPQVQTEKSSDAKKVNLRCRSKSPLENPFSSQKSPKCLSDTASSDYIQNNIDELPNISSPATVDKKPYNLRGKRKLSQRMQSSIESGDIGPKKTRKCTAAKHLDFDNIADTNEQKQSLDSKDCALIINEQIPSNDFALTEQLVANTDLAPSEQTIASKALAITESVFKEELDYQAYLKVSELCSQHRLDIHDVLSLENVQKLLSDSDDAHNNAVLLVNSYKSVTGKIVPLVHVHMNKYKLKDQLLKLLKGS